VSVTPSDRRIAVIGTGHVGSTVAYALMLRELAGEIVLLDANAELAAAEAHDIEHANALARRARIWAGDYAEAASASIAVITAGATMNTAAESRLSLVNRSAAIVRSCVGALTAAGFGGIIVIASNPVDIMAQLAHEISGMPAGRVIGTGTLVDSARLRSLLGTKLGVDPQSVVAYVLGEHGDSELAAFSLAQAGAIPVRALRAHDPLDEVAIEDDVRRAGLRIFEGKGYTSFGVASAAVRICEAIVWDEHAVMPVSALLTGQYGISGVYLSLPCVVGAAGVDRIMAPQLDDDELRRLRASASVLEATHAALRDAQSVDV